MLHTRRVREGLQNPIALLAVALILGSSHAFAQVPPPMPPARTIEVFGQHIQYYEQGHGANVIFLHGLGGEASNWAANIGPVGEGFHVYALDQIGFGHSDKPLVDYKIATFVDFLRGFMQELKIPKATLVGNSLGGWIAVEFAVQHPEMVDELVLVDAAGLLPEGVPGFVNQKVEKGPRKFISELVAGNAMPVDLNPSSLEGMRKVLEYLVYNKQAISDDMVQSAFEGHLKSGDGYTIQRVLDGVNSTNQFEEGKLQGLHLPTLVIWGREDRLIPLDAGKRYQKGVDAAELVVISNCGHIPQIEKSTEFNRALLDFLAKR
jgi:2-hydroxy-6-oxonona-2,4-dienedioate hydrolase